MVVILKSYAAQKGAAHLSSGGIFSILLALSPFLFGVLVINLTENPRAVKYLALALIIQTVLAMAGYYHALFIETGIEGVEDMGLIPLYQFGFIGIAAAAVRLLGEKKTHGAHKK